MKGFSFNAAICLGCAACQVACKDRLDLPEGVFARRVVYAGGHNYSGACNHCEKPACVDACPTGAMYKADSGLVLHDDSSCIGCGACAAACPYGAPFLSPSRGVAVKCDGCADLQAAGLPPVCVAACPVRALRFCEIEPAAAADFLPDPSLTGPSLRIEGIGGAKQ